MRIDAEKLLGSAKRISERKEPANSKENNTNSSVRVSEDSIQIEKKVDARLDRIESELKNLQNELTSGQMTRAGLTEVSNDLAKDGKNSQAIIESFSLEKNPIVSNYLQEPLNSDSVAEAIAKINEKMENDISSLKKGEIELANILASNLVSESKSSDLLKSIESDLANKDFRSISGISNLNAETVKKLI